MGGERILVVEDDRDLAASLVRALVRAGYRVDHAATGRRGLELLFEEPPELLLLDLNLPDMDGLEVCRAIREAPVVRDLPVIMLTARAGESDRVSGLDLGADDYVTKPFSLRELTSRIGAQLRRRRLDQGVPGDVYRDSRLEVHRDSARVLLDGTAVRLTAREMELLWYLLTRRPRVISRERILERVWGLAAEVETRTIDVHVRSLRKKLGSGCIETLVGRGYRFVGYP